MNILEGLEQHPPNEGPEIWMGSTGDGPTMAQIHKLAALVVSQQRTDVQVPK